MEPIKLRRVTSGGVTCSLARNISRSWLIGLRESNPAILGMFAGRDMKPYRDLLPWSGEFAGKYITGAYYIWRETLDAALYAEIRTFIAELLSYQAPDGYLGCYASDCRLTGAMSGAPEKTGATWDAWSHYHIMYGLLLWYGECGDPAYLEAAEKIARCFEAKFYGPASGGRRLVDIGSSSMNLAPLHAFALLYGLTRKPEYLAFAEHVVSDLTDPEAGDFLRWSESGKEYYQCPRPRWESLHTVAGIAEMYRVTGEKRYLDCALRLHDSILRTDVHNTGAFSTDEQAVGNPWGAGPVESCCVVAYDALGIGLYGLTGGVSLLDQLEISHYNACLGMWSPSGRWSTYDTPMDGVRRANTDQISFQCRPGSPYLNCCSVNTPRGVGQFSDWAFSSAQDGALCVNAYEAGEYETCGGAKISISGNYPAPGRITVHVDGFSGRVSLRVPGWSERTSVCTAGVTYKPEKPGYLTLDCAGTFDASLDFDYTPRFLRGGGRLDGLECVYVGPLLLGADADSVSGTPINELPPLDRGEMTGAAVSGGKDLVSMPLSGGITLKDFYHLGASGCAYRTWLRIK